jgi:uncharacterized damage-inducible protein DinB
MTKVVNWFERKFEFSFPVEQYATLFVRLRGTPTRLDEMLRGAPQGALAKRPGEKKWSAQEHAGHLEDLEPLWLARVEDYLKGGQDLTAADLTNRKTDEAGHNSRSVEDILRGFRSARLHLVNRVSELQAEDFSKIKLHPRLKQPMRLVDHLYFVAEHDDHHLAKIWELIS